MHGTIDNVNVTSLQKKSRLNWKVFALSILSASSAFMAGCGAKQTDNTVQEQQESILATEETTEAAEERNELLERYQEFTLEDTITQDYWDTFVTDARDIVGSRVNSVDEDAFNTSVTILNLDYLDNYGRGVLLDHFAKGQDVESQLNRLYTTLSQVREWNTELETPDDYLSFQDLMMDENDREILAVLDDYAQEVISLKQDLTKENVARIQEIFDIVANFSNGTGTITVGVRGNEREVAQVDLSRGGIYAAENVAQTISVMSKDIVSQEKRENLDNELRAKDTLAKTQEKMSRYLGITEFVYGVDEEAQNEIVDSYYQALDVLTEELAEMGVTAQEAQDLYTVVNIEYFMDAISSQHAFDTIYEH